MLKVTAPGVLLTDIELQEIIKQAALEGAKEALRQVVPFMNRSRPASVTQAEAARILGKSKPTIGRLVKSGVFRLNALGKIPIEQVDSALTSRR